MKTAVANEKLDSILAKVEKKGPEAPKEASNGIRERSQSPQSNGNAREASWTPIEASSRGFLALPDGS